ncbi:hypothetical protein N7G274_001982 [Stereocaulon virgatum]|uniref:Uncharacterized protein n=1 Tax=Stereocaulon virgatum TaxID=373712 RepID=A0ABR4AIF1_9LECA
MDSSPQLFPQFVVEKLQTRQCFLGKQVERLQRQLDHRINAYQMTSEILQSTINMLANSSHLRRNNIPVLRGNKLFYEMLLAAMEKEVFQMMQTMRGMRENYRGLMAHIQNLKKHDGNPQAQLEWGEK